MSRAAVDANVLIAARLSRDQHHEPGLAITEAFDTGQLPSALVLSDVLQEVINYLVTKGTHDVAAQTLDAILESSGFEVTHTPKRDFSTGRMLFRKYDGLSLTDSIIVAAMRRLDLTYLYSFDEGFDAVDGIRRLTTAENPFEPDSG